MADIEALVYQIWPLLAYHSLHTQEAVLVQLQVMWLADPALTGEQRGKMLAMHALRVSQLAGLNAELIATTTSKGGDANLKH